MRIVRSIVPQRSVVVVLWRYVVIVLRRYVGVESNVLAEYQSRDSSELAETCREYRSFLVP